MTSRGSSLMSLACLKQLTTTCGTLETTKLPSTFMMLARDNRSSASSNLRLTFDEGRWPSAWRIASDRPSSIVKQFSQPGGKNKVESQVAVTFFERSIPRKATDCTRSSWRFASGNSELNVSYRANTEITPTTVLSSEKCGKVAMTERSAFDATRLRH